VERIGAAPKSSRGHATRRALSAKEDGHVLTWGGRRNPEAMRANATPVTLPRDWPLARRTLVLCPCRATSPARRARTKRRARSRWPREPRQPSLDRRRRTLMRRRRWSERVIKPSAGTRNGAHVYARRRSRAGRAGTGVSVARGRRDFDVRIHYRKLEGRRSRRRRTGSRIGLYFTNAPRPTSCARWRWHQPWRTGDVQSRVGR